MNQTNVPITASGDSRLESLIPRPTQWKSTPDKPPPDSVGDLEEALGQVELIWKTAHEYFPDKGATQTIEIERGFGAPVARNGFRINDQKVW